MQLQRRDAIRMGRHQIGRPEPRRQRQLGVVHDGAGGHRGLPAAAGALPGPRLGLQFPGFAVAAAGADETLGPARFKQVSDAGRFIAEAPLEVDQRAWKIGHLASPEATIVRDMFYHGPMPRSNILWPLTQRDKPYPQNPGILRLKTGAGPAGRRALIALPIKAAVRAPGQSTGRFPLTELGNAPGVDPERAGCGLPHHAALE